jgi:hypothetical protein
MTRRVIVLLSCLFSSHLFLARPVLSAPPTNTVTVQKILTECRAAYFRMTDYRGRLHRESLSAAWTLGQEPYQEDIEVVFRKPGFLSLEWKSGRYAGTTLLARPGWNQGNFVLTLGEWFDYVRVSMPLIDISEPFGPSLKDVHEWLTALVALSRRPASDRSLQLVQVRTADPQLTDGQTLLSVPAFLIPFRDNTVAVYEFTIERGTGIPVALTLRGPRGEIRQRLSYTDLQVNVGVSLNTFEPAPHSDAVLSLPQAKASIDIRGFTQHWRQRYAEIADYTGVWILTSEQEQQGWQERKVVPLGQAAFKFRKPFDVYLAWDAATEALYRQGWNADRVRVRTTLAGLPVIGDLEPEGSVAQRELQYPITAFGLNQLVERTQTQLLQGWLQDELEARFLGVQTYTGQSCYVFEFVFPNSRWRVYPYYRMVEYWDITRRVPIRLQLFDWNDRLVEGHAFHQLRLNVSLGDTDFDAANPDYDFLLFRRFPWLDWFLTGRD